MKKILFLCALTLAFAAAAFAQPRVIEKKPAEKPVVKAVAPTTLPAKYEGGMFGYSKKQTGTLKLDNANERLVFYGKDAKELFGVPYDSMLVIYPQSKSVQSTTGSVVGAIPLPGAGIAGMFIREKRRYLIIQFSDPDVAAARGTLSFKLENKELLDSVLQTIADRAEMKQRGDAYYRQNPVSRTDK